MKKDWYTYLTEEFKLSRETYRVNERYPFTCPKCKESKIERLNHVKSKLKKLGFYECGTCRKRVGIKKARKAFTEKYDGKNPFQLESVRTKIKKTNLERYGVDCVLKKKEFRAKGVKIAAEKKRNLEVPQEDFKALNEHSRVKMNAYHNKYAKDRSKSDVNYKMSRRLRSRLATAITKDLKKGSAVELLGCSIDFFKKHIESQFEEGMSWKNWKLNGWHLDHKIPLSAFDLSDEKELSKACHYTNLRPIWCTDNIRKKDRLPKVYVLTGCFGSGKTTIQNKLEDAFEMLSDDEFHTDLDAATKSKPVLFHVTNNVAGTIISFKKYFETEVIVIQEPFDIILDRLESRSSRVKNLKNLENRIKRMKTIAQKYGDFSGTADECLQHLRKKIKPIE